MAISDTVTAPAFWAGLLVNGDSSGFDDTADSADRDALARFESWLAVDGWSVHGIVDDSERFTWSGRLYFAPCDGCDVCDYIILRSDES